MTIQKDDDLVKDLIPKRKRRRGAKARQENLTASTSNVEISSRNRRIEQVKSKPSDAPTMSDSNLVSFIDGIEHKKRNSSEKIKKKKLKVKAPKPGEEGFLTPTQLRNARKRRAKRLKGNKKSSGVPLSQSSSNVQTANNENFSDKSRDETTKSSSSSSTKINRNKCLDPSLQFIRNPAGAPIVQTARRYFKDLLPAATKFKVHLGPTKNWRTVSKLPVRAHSCSSHNNEKLAIGLFQPNSHQIVPITGGCRAHHPSIDLAVQAVTKACQKKMTPKKITVKPFSEQDGTGHLRFIAVNVERKTSKVQLTLVWNSKPYDKDDDQNNNNDDDGKILLNELVSELINTYGTVKGENCKDNKNTLKLHSLWVHFNAQWKHANSIFQYNDNGSSDDDKNSWVLKYGPPHVEEVLLLEDDLKLCYTDNGKKDKKEQINSEGVVANVKEVKLHFPPNVFRQANMDAFSKIVLSIRKHLYQYNVQRNKNKEVDDNIVGEDKDKKVSLPCCLELYGGVGTIGLNVQDLVSCLISSDENPHNLSCFEKSVEHLSSSTVVHNKQHDSISYIPKNATDMVRKEKSLLLHKAEVLIVDPPRKGFEEAVTESLISFNNNDLSQGPKVLIYISCGFDAFQKDCNQLLNSGLWKLSHAEGHILFPGSDAIETLAIFHRIK